MNCFHILRDTEHFLLHFLLLRWTDLLHLACCGWCTQQVLPSVRLSIMWEGSQSFLASTKEKSEVEGFDEETFFIQQTFKIFGFRFCLFVSYFKKQILSPVLPKILCRAHANKRCIVLAKSVRKFAFRTVKLCPQTLDWLSCILHVILTNSIFSHSLGQTS